MSQSERMTVCMQERYFCDLLRGEPPSDKEMSWNGVMWQRREETVNEKVVGWRKSWGGREVALATDFGRACK